MAKSSFAQSMSRRRKSPELHAVDEAAESDKSTSYVRLDPEFGASDEQEVVKLATTPEAAQRLVVPVRDEVEMRSNEPDIESIIDAERASLQGAEATWGQAAEEKRPLPWGWFALIGLALVGISGWALKHIIFTQDQVEIIHMEAETLLDTEQSSYESARVLIDSIESSLFAYFSASNIDEKASVVRHPERVLPLMRDHYSRHPFLRHSDPVIETLRPLTLGIHGNFWLANMQLPDGTKQNLIVQTNDEEKPLIDWETAVNYQPMAWDEYVQTRPKGTSMDFRVYLTPDNLYSHEFRDSEAWDCYMLTAHNSEEILFGYVRSDSPSAELFRTWFERHPNQRAPMILRLTLPENITSPSGVVIEHALSVRWIYIVSPVAES